MISYINENIRVIIIFVVGIAEAYLLYYFNNNLIEYIKLFGPTNTQWLGPLVTLLIAAPIAFFIWAFRNKDKIIDQKHAEENIRQDDFHKIEEWATSFSKDSQSSDVVVNKEGTLQIAAIYQLLPYLKNEHGKRFIRPSMEIYHSLLSSWDLQINDDENDIKKINIIIENKPEYIDALLHFNSSYSLGWITN